MINPVNAMLFTMLVWGVAPVFIRSLSVGLGAADALVIRYVLASIGYAIGLYVASRRKIDRKDWPRVLFISMVGIFGYNLGSVYGFELVPAGVGGIIIGTQPLLIVLTAAIVSRSLPAPAAFIGLVLAFAGTALLFWNDLILEDDHGNLALGGTYIFLSGVAWALYVVFAKPLILKYGPYQITALTILIGTVPILGLTSFSTFETLFSMTSRQWMEMFYMVAVASLMATVAWNFAASRLSSVATGAFLYLVPVIAVTAGALLLGETITPSMIAGGFLILLGVAIAQYVENVSARLPAILRFLNTPLFYAYAAIAFSVVMWGLVPVAVRFLVSEVRPETVLVLRLFPTGIIAIIALLIFGMRPLDRQDWTRVIMAALIGNCGYQILAHFGLKMVPASWTGMIYGLEPLFIALFAIALAGERLTLQLALGMAIALSGVAILTLGGIAAPGSDVSLIGVTLVILSTMGWGIYTVAIRPLAQKHGSLETACLTLAVSAIPMLVFVRPGIAQEVAALAPLQWTILAFLILCGTFLTLILWNHGVATIRSSAAGMWLYVQPVVAAAGGVLLLGETVSWPLIVGGAVIIAGVAISQWRHVETEEFPPMQPEPRIAPVPRHRIKGAVERLVASAKEAERFK